MPKTFACSSDICGGAQCCKTDWMKPAISVGDIIRISEERGMNYRDFLREFGSISYYPVPDSGYQLFFRIPCLKNEPCPYLDGGNLCGIYNLRPGECAGFPFTLVDLELPQYGDFPCLADAEFTPEQKEYGKKVAAHLRKESDVTTKIISPGPFSIRRNEVFELINIYLKGRIRSELPEERIERGRKAARELYASFSTGGTVQIDTFREKLSRMLYPIEFPRLLQELGGITQENTDFFRRSTEEHRKILELAESI